MKRCPTCNRTFPDTKIFCSHCGEALPEADASEPSEQSAGVSTPTIHDATQRCPNCDRPILKASAKFCRFCGAAFSGEHDPNLVVAPVPQPPPLTSWPPESGSSFWKDHGYLIPMAGLLVLCLLALFSRRSPQDEPASPVSRTADDRFRSDQQKQVKTLARANTSSGAANVATTSTSTPTPGIVSQDPRERWRVLHEGVVAYWRFNGTTLDASGYRHNAIPVGDVSYASTAVEGRSAYLGGSASALVQDSDPLRLTHFTIAAWVGAHRFLGGSRVLEKGSSNSYYVYLDPSGRPVAGFYDGQAYYDLVSPIPLSTAKWGFVAATHDGGSLKLYVNGSAVAERAVQSFPYPANAPLVIGWKLNGTPTDYFNGFLDEIRIYRRALTTEEIQGLYRLAPFVP